MEGATAFCRLLSLQFSKPVDPAQQLVFIALKDILQYCGIYVYLQDVEPAIVCASLQHTNFKIGRSRQGARKEQTTAFGPSPRADHEYCSLQGVSAHRPANNQKLVTAWLVPGDQLPMGMSARDKVMMYVRSPVSISVDTVSRQIRSSLDRLLQTPRPPRSVAPTENWNTPRAPGDRLTKTMVARRSIDRSEQCRAGIRIRCVERFFHAVGDLSAPVGDPHRSMPRGPDDGFLSSADWSLLDSSGVSQREQGQKLEGSGEA
ncbi:hypothetical protein N658DRAFT_485850 [Parathielavia hyrcaniae]|uniref:Uncharacterized protein n=1 Tax=Parathielavia hyrcaniae TaxID=113614 RepID=A0AAN6T2U2_9PEZI|nr:hypothetical protein N658DRAFT_485850 [Parathielavia hyrcaniae]